MSRRKSKRNARFILWILAAWALLIAGALTLSVIHAAGWLIMTAAIGAGGYWLGREHERQAARQAPRKAASNAAYGPESKSAGRPYLGGSLPEQSPPAGRIDARSAYPPEIAHAVAARDTAISALVNLGWRKADVTGPVSAAAVKLSRTGNPVTSQDIIRAVLREAGENKSERIEP